MRILIVTNLYPPEVLGGYEILCAQIVASLVRRGHRTTVLTTPVSKSGHEAGGASTPRDPEAPGPASPPGTGGASSSGSGPAGERVYRTLRLHLPFGEPARLDRSGRQRVEGANRKAAAAVIAAEKPDIAFVWSQLRLGLGAAREAEKRGLPVVYTMNDDHVLGFRPMAGGGPRGAARFVAERILFPASTYRDLALDPVLVISDTVRKRLASVDGRFSRARVVFQGVPLEKYPVKKDPGAASDPFRLLYAGQLHRYKGVHTLVEAAGMLAKRGRYRLTIAGAGAPEYEESLKSRAAELGIDAEFPGRVPQERMGELYREADLLAFTSVWDEPFGLTHLEAMASGTPVVSVGHGGPGEFLRDGVNALLFEKEDPGSLASAVERLAGDDALRRRIALAGRRTVEEQFTLERYADRLEAVLEGALADRIAGG